MRRCIVALAFELLSVLYLILSLLALDVQQPPEQPVSKKQCTTLRVSIQQDLVEFIDACCLVVLC